MFMKKWLGFMGLGCMALGVVFVNLSAKGNKPLSSVQSGDKAPDFTLTDINGEKHSLSDYKGRFVVLEWVNYGCPYVQKHYDTGNMQRLQKEITGKKVVWLSICSSAEGKQGHLTPAEWKEASAKKGVHSTSILLDPEGGVGRKYGAKTTPHMFLIDPEGKLIYQGAIDDKPTAYKEDVPGAENYILAAVDQALKGDPVKVSQTESYGCSVKY